MRRNYDITTVPVGLLRPGRQVVTRRHLCSAYRLNTYGSHAFSVASPTVWNSLTDFIEVQTISAECFRRLLKT